MAELKGRIKMIRSASEPEVIAEFLRSEYYILPAKLKRKKYELLLNNPDFMDEYQNKKRKDLLRIIRGDMVDTLPANIDWRLVKLSIDTLKEVNVMDYPTWNYLSEEKHSLKVAVFNIKKIKKDGFSNAVFLSLEKELNVTVRKIFDIISNGLSLIEFRPILMVASENTTPTLIEGAHRASALCIIQDDNGLDMYIHAYLGIGNEVKKYKWVINI
jgi:hypothetical protein